MTHKIKIVSLLLASIMLFFVGCKKNNSENETPDEPSIETMDEVIPEEIIQLLDNCPITNYQDPSVFGFNGKSDNPLDNLFAAMCKVAMHMTDTTEYVAGEDPIKEPRQKGLAYVYGYGKDPERKDKNYLIRRRSLYSDCPEKLHGFDCSGFIAHVMDSVGIHGLKNQSLFEMKAFEQVNYFNNNLKRLKTNQYTGLVKVEEIKNVGVTDIDDIKNGDIIYKIKNGKASHIGIFFKTEPNGELIMFQSSGNPYTNDCTYNRHERGHGPIQRELHPDTLKKYFIKGGEETRLLRITADTNWVDLGLPSGILWAARNEAADSPNEFGAYFAWADIIEKPYYDWEHYRYWNNGSITKYNASDGLTTLQPADDAATVYLENETGSRMPTRQDWQELFDNTTNIWTTQKGVYGRLFTASNGNSLFLPAAGFRHLDGLFSVGEFGIYWSSSRSENDPSNAWYVRFNADTLALSEYIRFFGLSIRPVRELPSNKD